MGSCVRRDFFGGFSSGCSRVRYLVRTSRTLPAIPLPQKNPCESVSSSKALVLSVPLGSCEANECMVARCDCRQIAAGLARAEEIG